MIELRGFRFQGGLGKGGRHAERLSDRIEQRRLAAAEVRTDVPHHDAGAAELPGVFTFVVNGLWVIIRDHAAAVVSGEIRRIGRVVVMLRVLAGRQQVYRAGIFNIVRDAFRIFRKRAAQLIGAKAISPERQTRDDFFEVAPGD